MLVFKNEGSISQSAENLIPNREFIRNKNEIPVAATTIFFFTTDTPDTSNEAERAYPAKTLLSINNLGTNG